MKRAMTAAVAALAVSGLAACGSSGGSAGSTPSGTVGAPPASTSSRSTASPTPPSTTATTSSPAPTPTATVTSVSDTYKWTHSLCSKLDVDDVAKIVEGVPKKQAKLVHTEVGFLTTDNCQFDLITSSEYGNAVDYGVSARTWTVADWQRLKTNSLRGDDTLKSVKLGAHGALVDDMSGWVLVGNRIVTVLGPFKATTTARAIALLKLAIPKAAAVKPLPALLGRPECAKANAEAAAVIGGPATVRRDDISEGGQGDKWPACGWATRGGSVSLFAQYTGSPAIDQIDRRVRQVEDAQRVKGLGVAAVYFPSAAELHVATEKYLVTIDSSGTHTDKKRLVALARAVLSNY